MPLVPKSPVLPITGDRTGDPAQAADVQMHFGPLVTAATVCWPYRWDFQDFVGKSDIPGAKVANAYSFVGVPWETELRMGQTIGKEDGK